MEQVSHGLALLQNGWAAFSFLATLAGLRGAATIAAVLVLGAWLPGFVWTPLIVSGAIGLALAGGLQAGQMREAAAQVDLDHRRALAAEEARTAAARRVTEALAKPGHARHRRRPGRRLEAPGVKRCASLRSAPRRRVPRSRRVSPAA